MGIRSGSLQTWGRPPAALTELTLPLRSPASRQAFPPPPPPLQRWGGGVSPESRTLPRGIWPLLQDSLLQRKQHAPASDKADPLSGPLGLVPTGSETRMLLTGRPAV